MKKLSLEWRILDKEHVALVFDAESWKTYEVTAAARQCDASDMIVEAVINLLGEVCQRTGN